MCLRTNDACFIRIPDHGKGFPLLSQITISVRLQRGHQYVRSNVGIYHSSVCQLMHRQLQDHAFAPTTRQHVRTCIHVAPTRRAVRRLSRAVGPPARPAAATARPGPMRDRACPRARPFPFRSPRPRQEQRQQSRLRPPRARPDIHLRLFFVELFAPDY